MIFFHFFLTYSKKTSIFKQLTPHFLHIVIVSSLRKQISQTMNPLMSKNSQKAWNDYYSTINVPSDSNIYSGLTFDSNNNTLTLASGYYYVFNCYFSNMTAERGAAILYNGGSNNYLLVEKCSLYYCKATVYTPGIRASDGNCIVAYVCGQHGYSDNSDGFCTIYSSLISSVLYSSISHCKARYLYTMVHYYGHINITSMNLSHNESKERCGLYCGPNKIDEKTKHGSDVLFSSFENNTATTQHCIIVSNYHGGSTITHEIKNCNIIENNSTKTILCKGKTDIISSFILGNKDPCFYTDDSNTFITLYNCSVDNIEETGVGTLTSYGSATFIHYLTFISTGSCYASFVIFDSLVPIQQPGALIQFLKRFSLFLSSSHIHFYSVFILVIS